MLENDEHFWDLWVDAGCIQKKSGFQNQKTVFLGQDDANFWDFFCGFVHKNWGFSHTGKCSMVFFVHFLYETRIFLRLSSSLDNPMRMI